MCPSVARSRHAHTSSFVHPSPIFAWDQFQISNLRDHQDNQKFSNTKVLQERGTMDKMKQMAPIKFKTIKIQKYKEIDVSYNGGRESPETIKKITKQKIKPVPDLNIEEIVKPKKEKFAKKIVSK
jgi:hypothetical protein